MNKRGLSGIITVVLFVLLILVAIGIIWAFVNPFITEGTSGVGTIGDCIKLRLEPSNCVIDPVTSTYSLNIQRGADESTLADIKLIFYDSIDNTEIIDVSSLDRYIIPGALGSRTYNGIGLSTIADAEKVGVSGVIEGEEEDFICEQVNIVECN